LSFKHFAAYNKVKITPLVIYGLRVHTYTISVDSS